MNIREKLNDPAWAWAPYQPEAERPWNVRWAGHLYRRAGFGGTWFQLQQAVVQGPKRTIDRLLKPTGADLAVFNRTFDAFRIGDQESSDTSEARAWWLRRILETPHPLAEQMTLFWHNFFGVGNDRVGKAVLVNRFVQTLRHHALGNLEDLFNAVTSEPAFFLSLEAKAIRKAAPANYFARMLLEQYTVGEGHFVERDVREVARAFTGWFVLQNELQWVAAEHDTGTKTILKQSGAFDGKGAVKVLLNQTATTECLAGRLFRWFISETQAPSPELLKPLAASLASDFNLARTIELILRSNLFFSPVAYRQKIKTPVEFALGIVRPMGATIATKSLGGSLADLGQDLFDPPTNKGWAGHRFWLNRHTLAGRFRLAQSILAGQFGGQLDLPGLAGKQGARFFGDLWLQGDWDAEAPGVLAGAGGALEHGVAELFRQDALRILTLPEFQLS
ncbi:MAG: DUF1800 family protein [Verrucomicrobiota bacterium]